MPRTHVIRSRLWFVCPLALICALRAPQAFAQAPAVPPAAAEPPAPAAAPVEPADAPAEKADSAKPSEATHASDAAETRAELDALKRELAEVKARQEEASTTVADDSASQPDPLKIYGFMDAGVQHVWVNENAPLTHLFPVNNTSFVVGNINVYLDAQPIKHFRGLVELRFTNAPFGDVLSYGGVAGTFQRKDTFSYDSGGTAINAPMWSASVILERAWIEWNEHQAFKLRVGNFFTPFGIWNEDHGTPTLISLALPQFIVQRWMPLRQTGLMVYGNAFAGDWELAYSATLSNGRQEISNLNFDNNFGVGARVYARRDMGRVNTTFGLSYFTGKTLDNETDIVLSPTGINGLAFQEKTTYAYNEHVLGADASIDIDATRIRAEAVVRRQVFVPGQRIANDPLFAPGSFAPDSWQYSAYLLVANQLPWLGVEPYLLGEAGEEPSAIGDLFLTASAGVNVHFNPTIQWKTQVNHVMLRSWRFTSAYDTSLNDLTAFYSRLVMTF